MRCTPTPPSFACMVLLPAFSACAAITPSTGSTEETSPEELSPSICANPPCLGDSLAPLGPTELPETLLINDGFEGSYDPRWTENTTADTSIGISTEAARSGASSLRLEFVGTAQVYSRAILQFNNPGMPYDKAHYGRAYIQTSADRPANEGLLHWDFVHAAGEDPSKQFRYGAISAPSDNGRHTWLWNHETWPRPEGFDEIGIDDLDSSIPSQTWICVEWRFDGNTNESQFWENGVERTAMKVGSPAKGQAFTMPLFTEIEIGLWGYQQRNEGMVLYIDDVVIAGERIGC